MHQASSERLEATKDRLNSGDDIRKSDDQQKASNLRTRRDEYSTHLCCTSFVYNFEKGSTDFRKFPPNTANWREFASDFFTCLNLFSKDHEEFKRVKITSFLTFLAETNANADRTKRCTQYAGIAGLENISCVTNCVAW